MQRIFFPAISVLNRLNYTKKFTLLWLTSLAAIAVIVYSLFFSLEQIIQPAQRQLQGLALMEPISRTVQLTQLHRGLSAALLGGNETMRDRHASKESEVAEAFKAMEKKLPPGLASNKDFRHIMASWEHLREQGLRWTADENFAVHTRLIEQIQLFELSVADDYALILDPELATFYLIDTAINKLPHALEQLGQLRAYGTGILARKRITEPQKAKLNGLTAKLDSTLREFRGNIERTGHHNPAVQESLLEVSDGITDSAQRVNGVASDILAGHFAMPPDTFLDMATAEIDKSYAQMYQALLPTAKTLIEARIARAKNTLITYISWALLLFLVVVYLSVSIYYSIVGNIQSLVSSLRAFANGSLHVRVKLDTYDELSLVGESFNEMAHKFSALLEMHREDEARQRATIETAMDAVVQMDAAGIITGWNSHAEKIFGWSCEEAVGQVLSETIIPPQYREAHVNGLKHFLLTGEGPVMNSRIEVTGLHRDGHEFPIELSIAPIKVAGQAAGNYEFSAFVRDITERKQYEEQLKNASFDLMKANAKIDEERAQLADRVAERTAQLLYANHAKDSFLATMSHEIRTPLGGLLGMMELLSLSRLDDEQRKMLQAARDSGESLLRIVDDILDWSKIEAEKLVLAPQVASIPEMLRKVACTYAQLASTKGITLRQMVDDKLSAAHLFDSLRLSQILNNFTSNAIKFTEQGTVEISAYRMAQFDGNEEVRFCVTDSGIGIDKEQQARLFRHYEQASADTARMYGGTGLGLAICRSLAELMGGVISVKSAPGSGSTFYFTVSLPIANPAAQRNFQLKQAKENGGSNIPDITPLAADDKRALLVDDHPVNRMLLRQQLELLGIHAEVAASGIEALSLLSVGRFDLVITDCHMPEMDGYELTRSIREMEQHEGRQRVPIIAWTANVLAEEEERCRAAGMDDILTKPTELTDLRAMLLKWLIKARLPDIAAPSPEAIPADAAQDKSPADKPIDFSVLKRIANSSAAQVGMLREFNLHNRSDIANLNAALKDGNPAAVARIAHRIKGASRMVGALELDRICTAIEKAAAQGDMNGAQRTADTSLDAAIERIEAAIGKFIGGQ